MKLIVVIGQSGSGKTTWVKKNFYSPDMVLETFPIKHTKNLLTTLVGDYTLNQRTLGTDTLPYNFLPKIINFVLEQNKTDKTLIVEGDRINNKKFFDSLIDNGVIFELHYFVCPLEISEQRLRKAGSKQTLPFMKTTKTKSYNIVEYLKTKNINIVTHNTGL